MLVTCLKGIRQQNPRIHCISNMVSAPLCANGLIALRGAPIMADAPEEVGEITPVCQGLSLNLGTPNPRKIDAMLIAGKAANEKGIPVVFDPVGVGASQFRRESAENLLNSLKITAIRGNLSEMRVLAGEEDSGLGVDTGAYITQENLPQVAQFAKNFAQKTGAMIAISSVIDLVTDGHTVYVIRNGTRKLSGLSGSGCLLSVLMTAFLAANGTAMLEGAVTALCTMGVCGQQAAEKSEGNGSFAVKLLDAISNLTGETLEQEANYEIYQG